jgi:hypothetical protein
MGKYHSSLLTLTCTHYTLFSWYYVRNAEIAETRATHGFNNQAPSTLHKKFILPLKKHRYAHKVFQAPLLITSRNFQMTGLSQPEWMKGFTPSAKTGNPHWKRGMTSPNPNGRPRGIVDKRTKVSQALMDDAPAVARVVIDAALAGDVQAAALVLSRVTPALRAQTERVEFDFDASAPITQQVEYVLQAIADGKVAADVGKQIIEAISALGAVRAVEELERRLQALEDKQA